MQISVRIIVPFWMVLFIKNVVTEVIVDVERDAKMSPVRCQHIFHIIFYVHRVN